MKAQERIEQLKTLIKKMEEYLNLKVWVRDWHGVADAAMDLRELEAELRGLENHGR